VSSVGATLLSSFEGLGTGCFQQQIDWGLGPQQLDESAVEAPADAERKRLRIETTARSIVVNVEIE